MKINSRLCLWLITILTLSIPSAVHAGLYRWVDANGKVQYSDVVPASIASLGHTELNARGLTVKTVVGAPSEEQIAEQKRRETLSKLRDSLEYKQQEQDSYLLKNYADLPELEATYSSKLEVLDKSTQSLRERREALLKRVDAVKDQLSKLTKTNDKLPEHSLMQKYLTQAQDTLANYDQALDENKTERERLMQHYQQDKERLKQLLNASPSSPHPDRSITPTTLHAELARQ